MEIDFKNNTYVLDGGMGTMLYDAGMSFDEGSAKFGVNNPDVLIDIHNKYVDAGADIIYACTFSMNRSKEADMGVSLDEAINIVMDAAIVAKQRAKEKYDREVYVALDIGPIGELLEPMGTKTFEEAVDMYGEVVRAGKTKADLIVIETMTDLYEMKSAVLAAKENSDLPIMASMSFEANRRTFTGTSLEAMAITLEGLGVDAMGINCSLGPDEIFPMIEELCSYTDVPVFAKPNAGLPNPKTGEYDIDAETFSDKMQKYVDAGVGILGGCCGTDPDFIKNLKMITRGMTLNQRERGERVLKVCSGSTVATVDHVTIIGERINPTGKKRLKQALIDEDYDYILSQAIEQIEAGAEILDVNVGVPKLDDVKMLPKVVKKLQSITGLPLQIDSGNAEAIEAALRVYNGKAIVNSVNGEEAVMERILPIVKKYGAAVVGLTLDENGIPNKAEERFAIAERILARCLEYGIPRENVIIDCLTLTVSAQQKEVVETLKAVRMVKEKLGLKTALGVSNISFGLPLRPIINRTFLTMAMECGLDLPIINPNSEDMMSSIYAFHVLHNIDENSVKFIDRYGDMAITNTTISPKNTASSTESTKKSDEHGIFYTIEKGMNGETVSLVEKLLKSNDELTIVNDYLIPALDKVGKGFEQGTIFLPQMLQAAQAAQAGFDVIKDRLAESDKNQASLEPIIIATVKGDIHDIGKNIVKVIMENYGFNIIDLGRDVDPELIVETAVEKNAKMVGLSALMTTTLKSMEDTIELIKEKKPDCKVFVGGAVLTADYAEKIGADYYCKDAMKSVEAAQEVFNG